MGKVLGFTESFFTGLSSFIKANPALASGILGVAVTLLSRFGLHVSADELAAIVTALTAVTAGLVHVSVKPASKPECSCPAKQAP